MPMTLMCPRCFAVTWRFHCRNRQCEWLACKCGKSVYSLTAKKLVTTDG